MRRKKISRSLTLPDFPRYPAPATGPFDALTTLIGVEYKDDCVPNHRLQRLLQFPVIDSSSNPQKVGLNHTRQNTKRSFAGTASRTNAPSLTLSVAAAQAIYVNPQLTTSPRTVSKKKKNIKNIWMDTQTVPSSRATDTRKWSTPTPPDTPASMTPQSESLSSSPEFVHLPDRPASTGTLPSKGYYPVQSHQHHHHHPSSSYLLWALLQTQAASHLPNASTSAPSCTPASENSADLPSHEDFGRTSSPPESLRKLAIKGQLMASAATTPSSPTISVQASTNRQQQDNQQPKAHEKEHHDTLLPAPAVAFSHALRSLNDLDGGIGGFGFTGQHNPIAYNSPYSQSIPSTAPGSPRMYV